MKIRKQPYRHAGWFLANLVLHIVFLGLSMHWLHLDIRTHNPGHIWTDGIFSLAFTFLLWRDIDAWYIQKPPPR